MAINIKIGDAVKEPPKFKLNIRQTFDGSFIVYDHPDIDIVVMPDKRKILVLTNNSLNSSDKTYDIQNDFFKYMVKKGAILPDSVHVGNVYGSLEGTYPELKDIQKGVTATDLVILLVSQWVEK